MKKPFKQAPKTLKITSYRQIPDIANKRIYVVKTVGNEQFISYRDFEGNIYNVNGDIVGNIDY